MIGHDIRSPLGAIVSEVALLERTPFSPEQARYLGLLRGASAHLAHMTESLLTLSRAEAGVVVLARSAFVVPALVDTVAAGVHLAAAAVKFTERGGVGLGVELAGRKAERVQLVFEVLDTALASRPTARPLSSSSSRRRARTSLRPTAAPGSASPSRASSSSCTTAGSSLRARREKDLRSSPPSGSTRPADQTLRRLTPVFTTSIHGVAATPGAGGYRATRLFGVRTTFIHS